MWCTVLHGSGVNKYFTTSQHIEYLLRQIKAAKLLVPEKFKAADPKDLRRCYNGIGPDRWSCRFREKATKDLEWLEPDALVHDWEYTYLPKTFWHFTVANVRFLYNGIKYAIFCSGFKRRAFRRIRLVFVFTMLCQFFGWNGFKKAKDYK